MLDDVLHNPKAAYLSIRAVTNVSTQNVAFNIISIMKFSVAALLSLLRAVSARNGKGGKGSVSANYY
jgi:hypothetical protein